MTFMRIFIVCVSLAVSVSSKVYAEQPFAALLQQGQDNIAMGHFREASRQLQQAEALAKEQQDAYTVALAQGLQGYIALQNQDYATAEQRLTAVFEQAKKNTWLDLQTRFALYLGQLQDHQHNSQQARAFFEQALLFGEKITDKSLLVSTRYQLAKLSLDEKQPAAAAAQLQQAKTLLENLPVNAVSSQLWLNIGYQTLRLYQQDNQKNDYLSAAFAALHKALTQAEQFSQPRIQASALKHLAMLYKQQQQPQEAIKLLQTGIVAAQKQQADDLLFDLEWQIGQLYKQQQSPQLAIIAYRHALKHLEAIRLDIPVSYEQGKSSFKTTFAPLYLGLADLLLQQAPLAQAQQQQALLKEAQDTLELMKKSELEDYFQSRCEIPAKPLDLQKNNTQAAAIYPILLPERLEIIVYTKTGLHQFTQPVPAQLLEQQVRTLVAALRNPGSDWPTAKTTAQLLYRSLIEPIKPLLKQQQIDTLIYIPDGALRLLPLAALSDGKKFLIEEYAVVNSAGMTLLEHDYSLHRDPTMLLVGMSVPGNVIYDLPDSMLSGIFSAIPQERKRQLTRDIKEVPKTGLSDTEHRNRQLRKMLEEKPVVEEFQRELSLPGVEVEIKQLAEQNQAPYFLNEDFSLANFIELVTQKPHKTLHIASHGFFGSTAEESFIMTSDKILTMNQLERLLNSEYFRDNPIDLITLSACQTAEGDDRSPLGISGIAIKSKAHSALGSLWPVADDATAQLMATFYQELKKTGVNKAQALQAAEIQILKQPQFQHPAFWAPFILVGDWL